MTVIDDLKAAGLVKKEGAVDLDSCDFIGLYFSAHWCPPCRGFTPVLVEYYNEWQASNPGKKLEIVFLSSDRDQGSFDEYFKEMPWAALDFSKSETKQNMSMKYGVRGIPTLVILDKQGETVSMNGRGQVMNNKQSKKYDFVKDRKDDGHIDDLKAAGLVKKEGAVDLNSCDFIGLYFSAHWCPPCRGFTPKLVEFYKQWQASNSGKKFEIVFLSLDRDQGSFDEYFKEMPWAALDFSKSETKNEISQKYGITGIPTLVILDKHGDTVTMNGRGQVMKGGLDFVKDA